jgi:SnoaL-like domain
MSDLAIHEDGSRWTDRLTIAALEAAYGPRWDCADAQGWSELFTEDGIFAVARADGTAEVRARGRSELRGRCELFNRDRQGVHLLQAPELSVSGDTARAIIPFTFWGADRVGSGTLEVGGLYKVQYRCVAGEWLIGHRFEVPTVRRTTETHVRDIDGLGWLSEVL